ncbi:substrate-binding domain-containing protein [Streptomyces sp. C8S0]|uniref:substrate-binding domain-containing protein n=1 Tax=Streptomyces sp. C8S0 TaxID=2585716 RepID=UPI0021F7C90D|nr:substrate-binding domain-containing protein [Streptomyces sp. C8S0]
MIAPRRPTALVFDNDIMAVAALSVAQELNLALPADLSIVAWDESPLTQVVRPMLSAVTGTSPPTARVRRPPCSPSSRARRSATSGRGTRTSCPAPARARRPARPARAVSPAVGPPAPSRARTRPPLPAGRGATALRQSGRTPRSRGSETARCAGLRLPGRGPCTSPDRPPARSGGSGPGYLVAPWAKPL